MAAAGGIWNKGKFYKTAQATMPVSQLESLKKQRTPPAPTNSVAEQPPSAPRVLTEEEYLNEHGAVFMSGADVALHRTPGGFAKGQRERYMDRVQTDMAANDQRREELRHEYQQLVQSGQIRPPTRTESLVKAAHGHEDNESTQAARRLLEKRGIDWQTGAPIAEQKPQAAPQQDAAHYRDYITKKSGMERAGETFTTSEWINWLDAHSDPRFTQMAATLRWALSTGRLNYVVTKDGKQLATRDYEPMSNAQAADMLAAGLAAENNMNAQYRAMLDARTAIKSH